MATDSAPGLTDPEVLQSRIAHGQNELINHHSFWLLTTLREVASEPMFLLLLVACGVYFLLGQHAEGATLIGALLIVSGISIYQSMRSERAVGALRELTQPRARVRRNGKIVSIATQELVVGDALLVEEGARIPADGVLVDQSDFTLDEAVLTGESVSVSKENGALAFAGTLAASGSAWLTVSAVGPKTELGRIGESLTTIVTEKSPLQRQVTQFVLRMAWIGAAAFVLVWGLNYQRSGDWLTALLFGLTLAMSVLPEEIPVAFSSFMALGAARLSRMGVLTKQPQTVESLGSATVICADKTGTITQEGMTVHMLYDEASQQQISLADAISSTSRDLLAYAAWASETEPFDAMEKAIVLAFHTASPTAAAQSYPMVHEYPLDGSPPMMTHVRRAPSGELVVAAKGAVEHVLRACQLTGDSAERIRGIAEALSMQGYRVLAVAKSTAVEGRFPKVQDDFPWQLLGLLALENPPKENAAAVIDAFTEAGIKVKLITGDFSATAQAIARQIGLPGADTLMTGEQVMALDDQELSRVVADTAVFARMFPNAKLRVVEALKRNGEVVAMTGDGVNDGPALKAAHIGVAMGKRGTEVARQAASLILVDDDLGSMVKAIAQGRRIYENFKKAVFYIVSIHIPIILTVAVPLLAGWQWTNLFTPIHVIFLELVMGPTCSIAFENEPAEAEQMRRPPRPITSTFLAGGELGRSIAQGLGISLAVLGVYYVAMHQVLNVNTGRTLVFSTLVMSNILLTLVNRSLTRSVFRTLAVPNPVLWGMLSATAGLLVLSLFVPPVQQLFGFAPVSASALGWCALAALGGVGWIEVYKSLSARRQ